jgi:heme exporter protein CcmD
MSHWHFVTLSYVIFFLAIVLDWWQSSASLQRLKRDLQARKRREQSLKQQDSTQASE